MVGLAGYEVIEVSGKLPIVYVYALSGEADLLPAASQAATVRTVVAGKVRGVVYGLEPVVGAVPLVVYLIVAPTSPVQVTVTGLA